MNKTLTINISGIIFHVEEDAYERLSKYISTIKGYFKNSEGRDEIISDIEARIAEMLQERVSPVKQVVLMADVDHVISVMGRPEEFAGDQAPDDQAQREQQTATGKSTGSKRLFRDPDDKLLGGVCSGIGHYFGVQPVWLRLALAISVCFFGFGVFLYILLWIIIPQAKTTAEKLEMMGEAVNINNIHKTFTEEFDELKKKVKDLKQEASDLGTPAGKEKMRRGAGRVGGFLEEFFGMLGTIIVKFFAGICIFIGVVLLFAMLASFFGVHSHNIHFGISDEHMSLSLRDFFHIFFNETRLTMLSLIMLILLFGVPCLLLIYRGIRVLFGLGKKNKIIGVFAALLWFTGLVLGVYIFYQTAGDFSVQSKNKRNTALKPASATIYVRLSNDIQPGDDLDEHPHRWNMFRIHDNQLFGYYPSFDILQSATDSFEVCIVASARGASTKEALTRAKNIQYAYTVKDSVLVLDPAFSFQIDDKWRDQEVRIQVKVPAGKMILLSKNLQQIVHNSDIQNLQDADDDDMVERRWIMTDEGLNCVDCQGLENTHSSHRHAPKPPETPDAPVRKAGFSIF